MKFSIIIITLCIVASPIIGVLAPRAFSFIPAALGLITCIEYLFNYKKFIKINWLLLGAFIAFLTLAITSSLWAINSDSVFDRVTKLAILIIPSLFLLFTARSVEIINFKYLCFLPHSLIIASILLLIDTYFNYPIYHLTHGLSASEIVAPASLNWSLVIISFLLWPTLYQLWIKKNKTHMAIVLIAVSSAIFSAMSQSAIIALILGGITLFSSIKKPKIVLYTISYTVIIGIFFSPWIAQLLFNHPPEIFLNWKSASAAQRIELWDFVARKALESPWYGFGIEATRHINDFDSAKLFYSTTNIIHPHNFALQLWIELGILGATSAATFIYLCLKNILTFNKKQLPFITACFTAMVAVNLVGYGVWQGWLIGLEFMVILIFIALTRQCEKKI